MSIGPLPFDKTEKHSGLILHLCYVHSIVSQHLPILQQENGPDYVVHIVGGLLTKSKNSGWLEFRRVAGGKYTLASINEFIPSLPWYFYKFTQAPIHAAVMKSFGEYLKKN